jgi:hypothetical protein
LHPLRAGSGLLRQANYVENRVILDKDDSLAATKAVPRLLDAVPPLKD